MVHENGKALYNNSIVNEIINKRMPISGPSFTILLLLFSTFASINLFNDFSLTRALALSGNIGSDNLRNLQLGSRDQFVFPEENNIGFVNQGGGNGNSNFYVNPSFGVRMQYPSDWQEFPPAEELEGLEIQLKPYNRQDVYFALFVFDTEPGTTQEDLNKENLQLISEQGNKVVQSGPMDIARGTIPAFFIEYENYKEAGKSTIVSVLMNGLEYVMEYGGSPQAYNRYLSLAEQMVESIEISRFDQGNQFDQESSGGGMIGNSNLLEYSNPNLGFRIGYPLEAEINEETNNVTFEMGMGSAEVSVIDDIGVALDEYSDSRIGALRDSAKGFHVIRSEESTLSGNPAQLLVYSTTGK